MSEPFYHTVRTLGLPILAICSRPLVLHRERVPRTGPCLLVANHGSVYDPVILIGTTPRMIWFLSIVELFRQPLRRWFLSAMGAHPLDRHRRDYTAVRILMRNLERGRLVGLFPQGAVAHGADSMVQEGRIPERLMRLVEIAEAPVLPCVILGGEKFRRWPNWLPLRRTRWAVAYGEPLLLRRDGDRETARAELREELGKSMRSLYEEVRHHV